MRALPPLATWPQQLLIGLVRGYRFFLSPWLGSACRFEPTCSAYSLEALQRHGATKGSYLTVCRLARCHPWCDGGLDPVPDRVGGLFSRFVAAPSSDAGRLSRLPLFTSRKKNCP